MREIIIILTILVLASCSGKKDKYMHDKITWEIESFNSKRSAILKPDSTKAYSSIIIKVEGETNDTIKIRRDQGLYDINLSGEIDTIISGDYYGKMDQYFEFDPYKCSDGNIEIDIEMI